MRHIFGPVPSRRFGLSLGVDIIPPKYCTLDCIYCQIGKTTNLTVKRKKYTPIKSVLNELKKVLNSKIKIDCITFSGSGEPTLNRDIGKLISEIKKFSKTPIVVITNGTTLYRRDVRDDLLQADVVAPSLDAILSFQKINRPHKSLDIKKIINGMAKFRNIYKGKIWLEVLLVKGINDCSCEIAAIAKAIKKIKPDKIHLNTVVRPPAENYATPVEQKKLLEIKKFLGRNCEIISEERGERREERRKKPRKQKKLEKQISSQRQILQILSRRPMQLKDVVTVVEKDRNTVLKELWLLERKRKIIKEGNWWKVVQ